MGIKRKRNVGVVEDSSEIEGNDTFINNSDYASAEVESEVNDSHGKRASDSMHRDAVNMNADKEEVNGDPKDDENIREESNSGHEEADNDLEDNSINKTRDHESDQSSVSEHKSSHTLNSTSTETQTDQSDREVLNSQDLKSDAVSSQNGVPHLEADSQAPLSFSQQQKNLILSSPAKRKDKPVPTKSHEPRLVISQLVLTNFKSYAGRQVIGPFNASFSAVVGPNGSGKSNVIDSMLFVFGFRASKMRQGKLSELIHNSSGGERLDFCQVDVHFENVLDDPDVPGKSDVIPDTELIISRRANKNNSSQYFINGKSSNYTEVTSLLRDKGVDLDHKRFLILQGEVESIAQMKAKAERESDEGLLEYLEDIIGTTKYKHLIEENSSNMEGLNEICLEKESRFELVEKDKESLESKKDEALRFLELEKKLISKKSIHYQANTIKNRRAYEMNEDNLQSLKSDLEKERLKNKELNKEADVLEEENDSIAQVIKSMHAKMRKSVEKQKSINKASVSLDEKLKNLNSKLKRVEKNKESSHSFLSMSRSKLENSKSIIEGYKEDLKKLSDDLEKEKITLKDMRLQLTNKTSGFTKEIETLQRKLEPWNDKLKEKEGAISLMNSAIEILDNQRKSSFEALKNAEDRLSEIKAEGKSKEIELEESEEKLERIDDQIALGNEQCNIDKQQLDRSKQQLFNLRQRTQDNIGTFSEFQNKNKVLASLMRLSKSGRIQGFYGRLGDLGVIDDTYDVAISTACPGLDSMVVGTVETAQGCIEYLRKNKLGYANFICLDKLRQFNLSPIQTPGNPKTVRRLFDLIIPQDPKFAPAFYSKIYNTLVVSNLQEAKSVAYGPKRWKVVTLDGKLVDTSGTMSGGGNYMAKGAMKLKNSNKNSIPDISELDVDKLKQELASMESDFERASTEYYEKESHLKKLKELRPETEFTISRLKLDIEALLSEKQQVRATLKKLAADNENSKGTEKIDREISDKQQEKNVSIRERDSLKVEMVDLEMRIKELEEMVMDAGGVELRIQNAKVDSLKQNIEIVNEKASNEKMANRKLENDIERNTQIANESDSEIGNLRSSVQAIEEEQISISENLRNTESEVEVIKGDIRDKEDELKEQKLILDEKRAEINKLKSDQIVLENKVEKATAVLKSCKMKIKENEESLKSLIVRETGPYIDWMKDEEKSKYNSSEIEQYSEEDLNGFDMASIDNEITELENYMSTVKVDIEVLKDYGIKKTEFESRRRDLNSAVSERDELKSYCEELKRKRLDEFMEGFNTISMSLKEMYQMITMGGNAELELVDSLDPFAEGILFSVMPPKKSWRNISNLSGGEKTLSSLALVFALHKYKPTPLYVMDEIDAALDFRNVSIVANYIKERTKNAQFVVISLRNNMFELAKQLVGIYKVNNMTRSVSLQNKDFLSNEKRSN